MSFEIDENTITPKTSCISSPIVELFSVVQALAVPNHHEFLHDFIKTILNVLDDDSKSLLEKIANFPFHGLQLYQFILEFEEYKDLNLLIDKILRLEDHEVISIFTDHVLNKENYRQLINQEILEKDIEEKFPWLFKESIKEIHPILYETSWFKQEFCRLLKEINQLPLFQQQIQTLSIDYQDANEIIEAKLKMKNALDVSQELMGKKFGRVFDYQIFIFCPSYFISPHRLRIHNEKMNIVIYDLRNNLFQLNQMGEEIISTLKVISDRTRLEILRRLYNGPSYGKLLANSLDLTTATISHHLEQLKSVGLVNEEKIKNTKYFRLNDAQLKRILQLTKDYITNQGKDKL